MNCFLALVIARLLARFLDNRLSVGKIAESLEKSSGSHMGQNWYVFDHADEVTDNYKKSQRLLIHQHGYQSPKFSVIILSKLFASNTSVKVE
jgi:hypothetical protein